MARVVYTQVAVLVALTSAALAESSPPPLTEFPDVVLVGNEHRFRCSGVLIDDRRVVTAAHCIGATRIGIGDDEATASSVEVVTSRVHPTLDVAVLLLARTVRAKRHDARTDPHLDPPLGPIAIVGFGVQDQIELTGFGLKRVRMGTSDGWNCDARQAKKLGCKPDFELTLRGHGNDTCVGDSGGGVFEKSKSGWRLIAITSRGTYPKRLICGEGGIYVRSDRAVPWAKGQTFDD